MPHHPAKRNPRQPGNSRFHTVSLVFENALNPGDVVLIATAQCVGRSPAVSVKQRGVADPLAVAPVALGHGAIGVARDLRRAVLAVALAMTPVALEHGAVGAAHDLRRAVLAVQLGIRRAHRAARRAARRRRSPPGCRPLVPAATSPARYAI